MPKIKASSQYGIDYFCKWLLVAVLWCGCQQHSGNDRLVFRYNQPEGIGSLDPAVAKNQANIWAIHQLYNTLVETDSSLHLQPSLAARWEVLPGNLVYTFHLRRGVRFHDDSCFAGGHGRLLTASDVVYSFQRLMDPATASSGAWVFNGRVDPKTGFCSLNDSTFRLTLLHPFRPVLNILSMLYCAIVPPEAVAFYGKDFRRHPVGTGPFRIKSWDEGQALILLRNLHYFETDATGRQLPYLEAVKVSFIDSRATEFLAFQQGQLDFINDIDPSIKDEVLTKTGALRPNWVGKIQLSKHPFLNIEYLGILADTANPLLQRSPLRLLQVRQAINYAFDRRKMMLYLRNSIGTPAESGFIPAAMPGFDSVLVKGYHYDPVKARQLLAAAGFGNGSNFPVIKLLTIPIYADLGSFIARQVEEVGIHVEVEVLQKSLLLEQTAKSQALFFRGSWFADYPDAENYLSVFYSKNPAPPNYTRFNSPEFDVLYERSLEENNDSLRKLLYNRMDQLVMNAAPVVPLWYDMAIRFVQPDVHGLVPNGLNMLELRYVHKGL